MKTEIIPNKCQITYTDDKLLRFQFLPKSSIEKEDAEAIISTASKLSGQDVHCNLVDIRQMVFMSREGRTVFGQQKKDTVLAIGVVMKSTLHKSLANLYLKFSKPSIETKMFDEMDDAESWLKSVIESKSR